MTAQHPAPSRPEGASGEPCHWEPEPVTVERNPAALERFIAEHPAPVARTSSARHGRSCGERMPPADPPTGPSLTCTLNADHVGGPPVTPIDTATAAHAVGVAASGFTTWARRRGIRPIHDGSTGEAGHPHRDREAGDGIICRARPAAPSAGRPGPGRGLGTPRAANWHRWRQRREPRLAPILIT